MCAQVRLRVIQRKILKMFVNTGPKCLSVFGCNSGVKYMYKRFVHIAISYSYKNSKNKKAILRKILRISMILKIRIFVNRKILILRIFLRKMIILRKILRIRLILRIRIFVNTSPGLKCVT